MFQTAAAGFKNVSYSRNMSVVNYGTLANIALQGVIHKPRVVKFLDIFDPPPFPLRGHFYILNKAYVIKWSFG